VSTPVWEPLAGFVERSPAELEARARAFHDEIRRRRTVRAFADRPVPRAVVEHCLRAAGTAPSGANLQPWHFAVIADPALRREIRAAAGAGSGRSTAGGRRRNGWRRWRRSAPTRRSRSWRPRRC
jgi:nitroreductase